MTEGIQAGLQERVPETWSVVRAEKSETPDSKSDLRDSTAPIISITEPSEGPNEEHELLIQKAHGRVGSAASFQSSHSNAGSDIGEEHNVRSVSF
jgi:hypothetical protein